MPKPLGREMRFVVSQQALAPLRQGQRIIAESGLRRGKMLVRRRTVVLFKSEGPCHSVRGRILRILLQNPR